MLISCLGKYYQGVSLTLPKATNQPTTKPEGTNTLKAYDQQGNEVYVTPGLYYNGISLTKPESESRLPSYTNQYNAVNLEDRSTIPTNIFPETKENPTATMLNFADVTANNINSVIMNLQQQLLATTQKQQELAKQQLENAKAGIQNPTGETAEEAKNRVLAEQQIKEKNDTLTAIMNDINNAKQAVMAGIQLEGGRIAPLTVIGRRQNLLQEQANARLGALSSAASVIQGDLDNAWKMAEVSLNAINQDRTEKLNSYNTLLDLANRDLINLNNKEMNLINSEIETMQAAIKEAENKKDAVMNLIVQNPKAAVLGKVNLTDDIETAVQKMIPYLQQKTEDVETQVVTAGGRALLINKNTGETIRDLCYAYKGATGNKVVDDYASIKDKLDKSKGSDGYVNTDLYKELRTKAKDKSTFDKNFSSMLNPNDPTAKALLGTQSKYEIEGGIWEWLASEEALNMTDEQKAKIIMTKGGNPEDFGIY